MTVGLALASGRPLLGDTNFRCANVALLNFEHGLDGLQWRQEEAMRHHEIKPGSTKGRFCPFDAFDGWVTAVPTKVGRVVYPQETAVRQQIDWYGIDVLMIDAFAEGHEAADDSDREMFKATVAWRRIARSENCAIVLVHALSGASRQSSSLRLEGPIGL